MKITLQEELKTYLKEHNHDIITLKVDHVDASSLNLDSKVPVITHHAPHHMDNYDSYEIDGFKVFIEKGILLIDDQLNFILETLLGIHGCHVTGVKLDLDL